MAQAVQEEWDSPYVFGKDGVTVVLRNVLEKNFRVTPQKVGELNAEGGFGKFARWKVHLSKDGGDIIAKFQSTHTNDYLRITPNGNDFNVGGKGGGLCEFKVERVSRQVCKLESKKHPGAYLAVNKNKGIFVGKGGPFCRIEALKEGKAEAFEKAYVFKVKNTVVIEHWKDKFLRVDPKNTSEIDWNGGKGKFAQFTAYPNNNGTEVQFQSLETNKYLRIRANDVVDVNGGGGAWTHFKVHTIGAKNEVRLESKSFGGKFLVFAAKDNVIRTGGNKHKNSIFTLYRNN